MFFLFRKSKRERLVVVLLDQRDDVTAHDILQHHKQHTVCLVHSMKTFARIRHSYRVLYRLEWHLQRNSTEFYLVVYSGIIGANLFFAAMLFGCFSI